MLTSSNTSGHGIRLWTSKRWMYRKYVTERLTEQEIAKLAGTSQVTIHKWLHKHGLKRDK